MLTGERGTVQGCGLRPGHDVRWHAECRVFLADGRTNRRLALPPGRQPAGPASPASAAFCAARLSLAPGGSIVISSHLQPSPVSAACADQGTAAQAMHCSAAPNTQLRLQCSNGSGCVLSAPHPSRPEMPLRADTSFSFLQRAS